MGINLEYLTLLANLKSEKSLPGGTVLELGAQDISAHHTDMAKHARRFSIFSDVPEKITTARELYSLFGYADYQAIDASGEYGAHVYDLNEDVQKKYGFTEQFDLVTNLGTIEHCFNIAQSLENMHNFCRQGGVMIHAFPANGNANHGLYNMQPRLLMLMAQANAYEVLDYVFTVDYRPALRRFSYKAYSTYDDRDLMCYVVFRKSCNVPFVRPFDSIFDGKNLLGGYKVAYDAQEFRAYIKGSWHNVKPGSLRCVPTSIIERPNLSRRLIKKIYDSIAGRI